MRILLVIGSLRAGGAERVMSLLATELERRGHELSLLTLSPPADDFFAVPHPNASLTNATASETQFTTTLMRAIRLKVSSGTGDIRFTCVQQSTQ